MDTAEAHKAFSDLVTSVCNCASTAGLTIAQTLVAALPESDVRSAAQLLVDKQYSTVARLKYRHSGNHSDGDINLDIDPKVSMAEDGGGAYVQAWVWVSKEDLNG